MKTLTLILMTALFLSMPAGASDKASAEPSVPTAEGSRSWDKVYNFAMVYGAQWSFYLLQQQETIRTHGSWDHFFSYMTQPTFDKDSFDYNIFKHALAGQYYYQFYRYRGYSEIDAFAWTFFSSLAFEFAIENYTEKPSLQDIYQTPIFGTLLGMGFERLSENLRSSDLWSARVLGYVLNPFAILIDEPGSLSAMPLPVRDGVGMALQWSY